MEERTYTYIIVGAGLAGASAIEGIRENDPDSSILFIGDENHLPYHRPPLTKSLWSGTKTVRNIIIEDDEFYDKNSVTLQTGRRITELDAREKTITDMTGQRYRFDKLLLATGGTPRTLPIEGGSAEGIIYYRYLDDFTRLKQRLGDAESVLVIGGSFIGSEIAASLSKQSIEVSMLFPEPYLCSRVFDPDLGHTIQDDYSHRGIKILSQDKPLRITAESKGYSVDTQSHGTIHTDIIVAGIGILPSVELARGAGLDVGNGIIVNEQLQTSHPDIYAAGDNALFPYQALGRHKRVEHWDNAIKQGALAGKNMAGAHQEYTYMPYFFSDLFDIGYEAVGETNTAFDIVTDWKTE
ncbi:MAG: NAD(P)/FAD-dependent oxidoreductase, partial [Chitinispirillaceae bacterium]